MYVCAPDRFSVCKKLNKTYVKNYNIKILIKSNIKILIKSKIELILNVVKANSF